MQLTVFFALAFSLSPIIKFRPVIDLPYPNPPFSFPNIHQQDETVGAQFQESVRKRTPRIKYCVKQRCSTNQCQCRKAGLTCTELCACSDDDEPCGNALQEDDSDEYIDDNDESDNSYDSASDDDEDD